MKNANVVTIGNDRIWTALFNELDVRGKIHRFRQVVFLDKVMLLGDGETFSYSESLNLSSEEWEAYKLAHPSLFGEDDEEHVAWESEDMDLLDLPLMTGVTEPREAGAGEVVIDPWDGAASCVGTLRDFKAYLTVCRIRQPKALYRRLVRDGSAYGRLSGFNPLTFLAIKIDESLLPFIHAIENDSWMDSELDAPFDYIGNNPMRAENGVPIARYASEHAKVRDWFCFAHTRAYDLQIGELPPVNRCFVIEADYFGERARYLDELY